VSGVSYDMGMVILFVSDANHLQHNVQAVGEYTVCLKSKCTDFPMDELEM
jgi:hypothetical protein